MNEFPLLDPLLLSLRVAPWRRFARPSARSCWPGSSPGGAGPLPAVLDAFCALPLVLPPTVVGYYLILLLGGAVWWGSGWPRRA